MDTSASKNASPKTLPSAVWSLVFGILSNTCLWILGSIPAIILGALALKKISANPEQNGGKGLALGGLITGGVGIIFGLIPWAVGSAIAIPALTKTGEIKMTATDQMEIRELTLACRVYAFDNDGNYPPNLEALFPDYIDDRELLTAEISTNPRVVKPYLYRPGLTTKVESREMFIAGPIRGSDNTRAVGYNDGSTERTNIPIDTSFLR
ncbi:MAG: hypothetical protein CMO55_05175 [Verrucomicrobiales bacterium]|nr:hypothetical protein [Verrucomicrobiales bacterium]